MKIKAKSKFNYKTIKAFTRTELFRKSNPLKKMATYCLISVLLVAVLLLEMFLLGPDVVPVVLLIVSILMLLLELYMYFVFPRIRYNALGQMKGAVHEFVFQDDSFQVSTSDNGYKGESHIDYDVLFKVIETSNYLYIFQNKTQALIVDKSTISGGTYLELRQVLQPILGERYVIYKY